MWQSRHRIWGKSRFAPSERGSCPSQGTRCPKSEKQSIFIDIGVGSFSIWGGGKALKANFNTGGGGGGGGGGKSF